MRAGKHKYKPNLLLLRVSLKKPITGTWQNLMGFINSVEKVGTFYFVGIRKMGHDI